MIPHMNIVLMRIKKFKKEVTIGVLVTNVLITPVQEVFVLILMQEQQQHVILLPLQTVNIYYYKQKKIKQLLYQYYILNILD